MSDERGLIELAHRTLTTPEFDVWITRHLLGKGRHSGARALGISEEAFRHRLAVANRKLGQARKEQAA